MIKGSIDARRLFIAQEGKCFYCEQNISPKTCNRDHFIPRSVVRAKNWSLKYNIVLTHVKCNQDKRDRFPTYHEVQKFKTVYKKVQEVVL